MPTTQSTALSPTSSPPSHRFRVALNFKLTNSSFLLRSPLVNNLRRFAQFSSSTTYSSIVRASKSVNGGNGGVVVAVSKNANSSPVTSVVFEPFEEVKELMLAPAGPQESLARQRFTDKLRLRSMNRLNSSDEEREHAEKLMEYQVIKGVVWGLNEKAERIGLDEAVAMIEALKVRDSVGRHGGLLILHKWRLCVLFFQDDFSFSVTH